MGKQTLSVPKNHGCGDPLEAPDRQTGSAEQDRGPHGRCQRRRAHPEGGWSDHGQRGQVSPASRLAASGISLFAG